MNFHRVFDENITTGTIDGAEELLIFPEFTGLIAQSLVAFFQSLYFLFFLFYWLFKLLRQCGILCFLFYYFFDLHLLIISLIYVFWLSLWFTSSDYLFDLRLLIISLIYVFWLPHWYLQIFVRLYLHMQRVANNELNMHWDAQDNWVSNLHAEIVVRLYHLHRLKWSYHSYTTTIVN